MTAVAAPPRLSPRQLRALGIGVERKQLVRLVPRETPPDPRRVLLSYFVTMVAVLALAVLVNLLVVSRFEHFLAQKRLYGALRLSLAEGSVPVGQLDVHGKLTRPGTPIALLEIPELGVREVVVEGTAAEQTKLGVGHRRDTVMPGQPGTVVLMGRSGAYGGVFGSLDRLLTGDEITVTTGQGIATYKVTGVRTATTQLTVLGKEDGRLTLVSATGGAFRPDGVLRVDAELTSKSFEKPASAIPANTLPASEAALKGDPDQLFGLAWLLELLLLLLLGGVWAWHRWSKKATWIVFVPALGAASLACADRICSLLPNLM